MDSMQQNLQFLSSFLSEATNTLSAQGKKKKKLKYCQATCPDPQCKIMMYFPAHELSVECHGCGQRHSTANLPDRNELKDDEQFQKNLTEIKLIYGGKKTAELVKVKGISNYQCKLLSPLLTTHGKDKNDQPRLLKELGMGDIFDCSKLASRAFAIEKNLLDSKGYGEDKSGSLRYLNDTLSKLWSYNDGRKCLVPVHADGDGHCLVHAVSRCLVGRELFWHALRQNMQTHLETQRDKYIDLMKDFLSEEEWPEIVAEAAPDYQPPDGQALGLRTVHIFALANILHRPIILLDSLAGMHTKGEYSGIFLPALLLPKECMTNNILNSPIVIAWSNAGYNHFIPLVPLKDQPLPKLPLSLRPEVWGVNESYLTKYINIDKDGSIELAFGKPLQDSYLQKLVSCMEQLFYSIHSVMPNLVADYNQHVYRSAGYISMSPEMVTIETKTAVLDRRLFRCLICTGISCVPEDWLWKDGILYDIACTEYSLKDGERYTFPRYGITAEYNEQKDILIPYEVDCFLCKQTARTVTGNDTIEYHNGDRTHNRADTSFSKCCGYKHYWDGKEYDNLPDVYPLQLVWKGRPKTVKVYWFHSESDPSLNSNMYEVASKVVAENYPAEFGNERLVQQVVEMLLTATETQSSEQIQHPVTQDVMETDTSPLTKTIISGMSATGNKILHKEELGISETERKIKRRVDQKMYQQEQRKQQTTPTNDKGTRKISPSPSSISPISPPSKISATDSSPSPSKPSPPSVLPSNTKKIRVTTSDGKTANLILSNTATFNDLQLMIEEEFSIPCKYQRLRGGYPPKELHQTTDNGQLTLSHGERISVEWIKPNTNDTTQSTVQSKRSLEYPSNSTLTEQITSLLTEIDSFQQLQNFPNLFCKGGHCYEELLRSYGNRLTDGMHVQFAEISNVTFRYNRAEERLEVCLGVDHVPVGPLTKDQMELAKLAATQTNHDNTTDTTEHSESVKWMLNRSNTTSNVKAFSGTGRSLNSQRNIATGFEEKLQNLDELIGRAQLVIALKSREELLHKQVRSLNQQLLDIHSGNEASATERITDLERKLIDLSSELKLVREEMKELS